MNFTNVGNKPAETAVLVTLTALHQNTKRPASMAKRIFRSQDGKLSTESNINYTFFHGRLARERRSRGIRLSR
jgi:transcriptional/translational regulatory protein YebC/TACO1